MKIPSACTTTSSSSRIALSLILLLLPIWAPRQGGGTVYAVPATPASEDIDNCDPTNRVCSTTSRIDAKKLLKDHPGFVNNPDAVENARILCPFWRMWNKADEISNPRYAGKKTITRLGGKFQCSKSGCGTLWTLVNLGQLLKRTTRIGKVNLESLHTATGIAHECGFAFDKGDTQVNAEHRNRNLARMAELAAPTDGRLSLQQLNQVKLEICAQQGVKRTLPGRFEVALIYVFLGGYQRGYIQVEDVERFFNGDVPQVVGPLTNTALTIIIARI